MCFLARKGYGAAQVSGSVGMHLRVLAPLIQMWGVGPECRQLPVAAVVIGTLIIVVVMIVTITITPTVKNM